MKYSIVSAVLLILSTSVNGQNSATASNRIQEVEQSLSPAVRFVDDPVWSLSERMEHYKVPGVSIAVFTDFKLDWAKAYGYSDSEKKIPATTETSFQAASISKTLNAVAFLNWASANNIDLDQDINGYLKSWQFTYDEKFGDKQISPRHLLSHMAGLSVHGFPGFKNPEKAVSTVEVLDGSGNTGKVKSLFAPGEKFKYSGGGTTITELILTDQSGKEYEDFQQENVFGPLAMKNSFYPRDVRETVANGHFKSGKQRTNGYNTYPQLGAAALWTTPTDLSSLIIELQLARIGKSEKVLNQEMAKLMTTAVLDGQTQALGTFVEGLEDEGYFTHGGSNEGFKCAYYGSLSGGHGVVVMVNSDHFEIINEIIRSVSTVYGWELKKPAIQQTKIELSKAQMKQYCGTFRSTKENSRTLEVSVKKGKLLLQEQKKWGVYLSGIGKNKFIATDINPVPSILFVENENGDISKMAIEQDGTHEWIKE